MCSSTDLAHKITTSYDPLSCWDPIRLHLRCKLVQTQETISFGRPPFSVHPAESNLPIGVPKIAPLHHDGVEWRHHHVPSKPSFLWPWQLSSPDAIVQPTAEKHKLATHKQVDKQIEQATWRHYVLKCLEINNRFYFFSGLAILQSGTNLQLSQWASSFSALASRSRCRFLASSASSCNKGIYQTSKEDLLVHYW